MAGGTFCDHYALKDDIYVWLWTCDCWYTPRQSFRSNSPENGLNDRPSTLF